MSANAIRIETMTVLSSKSEIEPGSGVAQRPGAQRPDPMTGALKLGD